jgi:hypothetical protein
MANANVSFSGESNNDGAGNTVLHLKVFAGEVLTAFEQATVTMDKHVVRQISSGKSSQFPLTWKSSSSYHTAGNEILGTVVNHAEKVITIDGLLISHHFVDNLDEAMNHYDVRSLYSREAGIALATQWDQNVLQEGVLGARASAIVTGANGGSSLINASYGTSGSALGSGLFDAAEQLDESNVPEDGRYMYVRPAQYYLMAETTDLINRDWGGSGVYARGEVFQVAGINIVKTNNLPITDLSGATFHGVNASTVKGLVMHTTGVATVKLLDMAVEAEYDIRRQGWLVVAKYAMGHGFIRPEACVELKTS